MHTGHIVCTGHLFATGALLVIAGLLCHTNLITVDVSESEFSKPVSMSFQIVSKMNVSLAERWKHLVNIVNKPDKR